MSIIGLGCIVALAHAAAPQPQLVDVQRIWDAAPHNAFTDLVFHDGAWYCVFREGDGHVSDNGALRVLRSEDGTQWESTALLTSDTADLRDAKITVTPEGKLMLSGAGALHDPDPVHHQSLSWFSDDGTTWSDPVKVGDPNLWLWRVTWHGDACYGVGYGTVEGNKAARLYKSRDGRHFDTLVPELFGMVEGDEARPTEASLIFREEGQALCLLRRDDGSRTAQLGLAGPPYTRWTWKDLGIYVGGPQLIELPDGRIVVGGRSITTGQARMVLHGLDPEAGTLTECLELPSGGDCSYPGLAWHDGMLWVSYYSSHEGKTSIYLARVKFE